MHPLLDRQLKRLGLDGEQPPVSASVWVELLTRVDRSYVEADQGHALLERSLALSSKEMQDLYAQLKRTSETQLAHERNKLQAVIQALGRGLCVVDHQWNIQMVNQQAELMFGADAQSLVGHPVYRMISPAPAEYRDMCLDADGSLPPLVSGESYSTEDGLLLGANGHLVPIRLTVTPIMLDGGVGAVFVFGDISHQQQIAQEQQRTEWLLRRIQIGLSELAQNPQVYGGDLREACRAITRVAAACLLVERVSIWFFTENRSAIQCIDLYQQTPQEHSQGSALAATTYPRYFQELDTERIVAADNAQTDPRTAEFADGYLVPLGITSMLDVPIRCLGKMMGVMCHEHVGPMRHWTLEEQHFAASVANTVALAIEAADRRKAEQALLQAKEAAEAASRTKTQFLANMSHEIRTPMNGVLGLTELLLGCPLEEKERRLAESVHRSGTALLAIINGILDFSKIEAGKVQLETIAFDIRSTVHDVVGLLQESARQKGLTLTCTIQDDLPIQLIGDPTRLRQVLLNLAGNAVKFTERGSVEITVECKNQATETLMLVFTVRDTGIGISDAAQAEIFDAFAQADGSTTRKYGGTGLGLAIAKQLILLMGGTIEVQSRPAEGSTFRCTARLGICETGRVAATPSSTPASSVGPTRRRPPSLLPDSVRILLVEDNPVNREVACGMLEALNYPVETVENGRQAVEAVATGRYTLVLMDCQMPEMDGLTATRLIREQEALGVTRQSLRENQAANDESCMTRPSRLPIIALTAHAMQGDRELCLAAGMDDYLTKPFTLERLEQTLSRWVSNRVARRDASSGEHQTLSGRQAGDESSRALAPGRGSSCRTAEGSLVDLTALAAIRALQRPGQPDILARSLAAYLGTAPQIIERLRQAVSAQDAAELRAAAHRLKSSSAQMGAVSLAAHCRDLEAMGVKREMNHASEIMECLEQDYAATCSVLEAELAKTGVPTS